MFCLLLEWQHIMIKKKMLNGRVNTMYMNLRYEKLSSVLRLVPKSWAEKKIYFFVPLFMFWKYTFSQMFVKMWDTFSKKGVSYG